MPRRLSRSRNPRSSSLPKKRPHPKKSQSCQFGKLSALRLLRLQPRARSLRGSRIGKRRSRSKPRSPCLDPQRRLRLRHGLQQLRRGPRQLPRSLQHSDRTRRHRLPRNRLPGSRPRPRPPALTRTDQDSFPLTEAQSQGHRSAKACGRRCGSPRCLRVQRGLPLVQARVDLPCAAAPDPGVDRRRGHQRQGRHQVDRHGRRTRSRRPRSSSPKPRRRSNTPRGSTINLRRSTSRSRRRPSSWRTRSPRRFRSPRGSLFPSLHAR